MVQHKHAYHRDIVFNCKDIIFMLVLGLLLVTSWKYLLLKVLMESPLQHHLIVYRCIYWKKKCNCLVQRYSSSFKTLLGMFVWIFFSLYTFFKTKPIVLSRGTLVNRFFTSKKSFYIQLELFLLWASLWGLLYLKCCNLICSVVLIAYSNIQRFHKLPCQYYLSHRKFFQSFLLLMLVLYFRYFWCSIKQSRSRICWI